jgi:hypothetical protein
MARQCSLMQRRRVRVPIWIFAGIEQHTPDSVCPNCVESQCAMPVVTRCGPQQPMNVLSTSEGSRTRKGHLCPISNRRVHSLDWPSRKAAVIALLTFAPYAQKIDQRNLDSALTWHAAGTSQLKRIV